ncbi:MAG: hypothetical protein HGGPFJEG_02464 [Ignavibacteria bacterium]|nr:hypothetical protein [Ignavibacteria bacterium]
METVTLSIKYQLVIPKSVRKKLNLKPGQKLQIIESENKIEIIPIGDVRKMRGILKGIDTNIKREKDRI